MAARSTMPPPNRRTARLPLVVLTIVFALLLAACGGAEEAPASADGDDAAQTSAESPSPAEEADPTEPDATEDGPTEADAAEGDTRTVEHALGTTEVPADPQRIVDMGNADFFEVAQVIGLTDRLIATTGAIPQTYDYFDIRDDVLDIGAEDYNLEAIAAADPHLIIGLDVQLEDVYDQLQQIAPTVALEFETSADFLETGRLFADALGGEEAVATYDVAVEEYLDRAAAVGEQIQEQGSPDVAIMRARTDSQRYELPRIFSGKVLYTDVGLPVP